jgi:ABC-2 type transport system permease protein
MSMTMFRRAVFDLRWTLFWYGGGLIVYSVLMISIYPMFQDMMADFDNLIEQYPEAVLRAFGFEGDLSTYAAFIGVEYINVIWPLIVAIYVIMAGTATVAQEIERGTADLWLSVPEERWRLLLSKTAAIIAGLVVLVLITVGSIAVGGFIVGEPVSFPGFVAATLVMTSYPFAILGYSVLLSALFSERGKAAGLAAALTLLGYLAWLIAGLTERFDWMKYISPFTAYKPQEALQGSGIPFLDILVLVLLGMVGMLAALIVFQRRDVSTV